MKMVNSKENSERTRKKISMTVIICIIITVIILVIVSIILVKKHLSSEVVVLDETTETEKDDVIISDEKNILESSEEQPLSESKLYESALEALDNEEYADAIQIFYELDGYKDSSRLIKKCYARYSGYYYDKTTGIYFHIQFFGENSADVEAYTDIQSLGRCTISEEVAFAGCFAQSPFTDSEMNSGTINLELKNDVIVFAVETKTNNSDLSIIDSEANYLLREKTDQPILEPLTYDDLRGFLSTRTTTDDIIRMGYSLIDIPPIYSSFDYCMYRIENTDIYLVTHSYEVDTWKEIPEKVVFCISGPASMLGDIKDDPEYLLTIKGNYFGIMRDDLNSYIIAHTEEGIVYWNDINRETQQTVDLSEYVGEYSDLTYDRVTIKENDNGYSMEIFFYRICSIEEGTVSASSEGVVFDAIDPSGNPITVLFYKSADGTYLLRIVDSTWLYIYTGDMYTFYREGE